MRKRVFTIVALSVLATTLALSGESESHKCTMSTQECLNQMAMRLKSSGWIGVLIDRGADDLFIVKEVVSGSPAERAGIQPGDTLYAMNGIPLLPANEAKLQKARQKLKPGTSVTYTIRRNGGSRDLTMTLEPMPADLMAKYIGAHMLEHAAQDAAGKEPKEPQEPKEPKEPKKH